jgi:hypothetical protein
MQWNAHRDRVSNLVRRNKPMHASMGTNTTSGRRGKHIAHLQETPRRFSEPAARLPR